MEEGSPSRFLDIVKGLFKKNDIEDHIHDATVEGELNSEEASMILNVLNLDDKLVYDIMIPRTDMVCAEVNSSLEEISELFIESGHSRIPLYERNRDNIVGIIHAKALLGPLIHGQADGVHASKLMRPPFFILENTNISVLLREFQKCRSHMAVALDEYGGTSGIVTIEDVLEQIVGEIRDEYDDEEPPDILKLEDGSLKVTGRAEIEQLSELLELDIDSETVDTIGGYLSEMTGRIPREGEHFNISGYRFTITEADPRNVRFVHIQPEAREQERE